MTLTDVEVVELLHDEPELLALADALTEARPRRRKLYPITLPVAAAVAAGVALALLFWPSTNGGIVERALAAVGDGPVVHAVLESSPSGFGAERIDLATGNPVPLRQTAEMWFDAARNELRSRQRLNGDLFDDVFEAPGSVTTLAGSQHPGSTQVDPLLLGFARGFRPALENGSAHVVGSATVDGRSASWLELTRPDLPVNTQRVVVDNTTGKPLAVQAFLNGKPLGAVVHVKTLKYVPRDDRVFEPIKATQPEVVPTSGETTTLSGARAILHARPLWLGEASNGYTFAGVTNQQLELRWSDAVRRSSAIAAVRIAYRNSTGETIEITESREPVTLQWRGIVPPPGTADVFRNLALLARKGLYVRITASEPSMALTAARALKPAE
jgi:hypothetical protein